MTAAGLRPDPVEAARSFVAAHFPDARVAIVGGSVIRGESTATSDLDIVIVAEREDAPFRASYRFMGWPIEAFVHTATSLPAWMLKDAERRRPSLCRMCAEGVVLRDDGRAASIQREARTILDRGPRPPTTAEIEDQRYALTDVLDDFEGVTDRAEALFIANDLAIQIADLLLLVAERWSGNGKWVPRALRGLDGALADRLVAALEAYYREGDRAPLIELAEEALQGAGGRLFEGYYRSAK